MPGIEELYDSLLGTACGAKLARNADMSRLTSFRTGGRAALFLNAVSAGEIIEATKQAARTGVPYYIIGNGTNLLVSDKGLDALVVRIGEGMGEIRADGVVFEAGAGAPLSAFAKATVEAGCGGLEWAAGIPGSVGGAVAMNAGAYGGEIAGVLRDVTFIEGGEVRRLAVGPEDMGYRQSAFRAPGRIVLGASFSLKAEAEAAQRMREYTRARREKQPLNYPSAGSTFKRPQGHFAGGLIEAANLKGMRVGGAMVSELHAGFIINAGGATSEDIYGLIRLVQQRVFENSGVHLETEVMLLGDFD